MDGVEELPVANMLERVRDTFSAQGWSALDELNWESDRGAFQLYTTPQYFRVDCYNMDGEDMNHFIDIANEFGCPLNDPQVGQRFDGS